MSLQQRITALAQAVGADIKELQQAIAPGAFFSLVTVTATATGQTSFTVPGGYTPGAIFVSLNGATLPPADFTAADGATVTLGSGAGIVVGSVLLVYVLSAFEVADALPLGGTAADSSKFGGNPIPPEDGKFYAFKDGQLVEFVAGSGGGDHVLSIRWEASRANIGDGGAAGDGQLLSRATYPDAWAAIAAGKVPVVSDADWLADPTKRGSFSTGDGSTTFRLPDYNGKFAGSLGAVFMRGDGALSAGVVGVIQRHATAVDDISVRIHTNTANATYDLVAPVSDTRATGFGSQYSSNAGSGAYGKTNGAGDALLTGSTETRPLNVTGVWVIKLFGAVVNVGSADAAQLASDYANLAGRVGLLEVGGGRAWQSQVRSVSTSYQNTSSREIDAAIVLGGTAGRSVQVSADASTWLTVGETSTAVTSHTFSVPVGWYYRVTGGAVAINSWQERRP